VFQLLLRRLRLRHKTSAWATKTSGGALGAMARIAPARLATPPNGSTAEFSQAGQLL
jgi:hypothetical protein